MKQKFVKTAKNVINKSKHKIKINTPIQASFHLNQGEILALPVKSSDCIYISKDNLKDDNYILVVVPKVGITKKYEGDFNAVSEMIKEFEFYVIKGLYLEERRVTFFDKLFNKVQLLLGRK